MKKPSCLCPYHVITECEPSYDRWYSSGINQFTYGRMLAFFRCTLSGISHPYDCMGEGPNALSREILNED